MNTGQADRKDAFGNAIIFYTYKEDIRWNSKN